MAFRRAVKPLQRRLMKTGLDQEVIVQTAMCCAGHYFLLMPLPRLLVACLCPQKRPHTHDENSTGSAPAFLLPGSLLASHVPPPCPAGGAAPAGRHRERAPSSRSCSQRPRIALPRAAQRPAVWTHGHPCVGGRTSTGPKCLARRMRAAQLQTPAEARPQAPTTAGGDTSVGPLLAHAAQTEEGRPKVSSDGFRLHGSNSEQFRSKPGDSLCCRLRTCRMAQPPFPESPLLASRPLPLPGSLSSSPTGAGDPETNGSLPPGNSPCFHPPSSLASPPTSLSHSAVASTGGDAVFPTPPHRCPIACSLTGHVSAVSEPRVLPTDASQVPGRL